jgi:hypothetical protein
MYMASTMKRDILEYCARCHLRLISRPGLTKIYIEDCHRSSAPYPILKLTGKGLSFTPLFDEDGIRDQNCFYAVENKTIVSLYCRQRQGIGKIFSASWLWSLDRCLVQTSV